ncbi:MAG: glycerol-3-phosphate 1-O-acyltransferase PlsY [Deferribacteraceae bacterium]|jgi:glycerol-3-phosphate acyltransferase PlsY|nr:glycerol-3-phosphate 1-O-acyltransferase PlsY [Deferribacteraceae bacterium]
MTIIFAILPIAICYLIGSIPTAYLFVKMVKGIDIRTFGSGNVGATNAGRAIGSKWGFIVVLILDALKGFLPLFVLTIIGVNMNVILLSACALILGHTFPIFLDFKGGKGVATGLGAFLALAPMAVAVAIVAFIILLLAFRMVSLGSIVAAVVLSVAVVFLYNATPILWVFTWILAAFVIYKHRSNVSRIIAGNENKVKFKR